MKVIAALAPLRKAAKNCPSFRILYKQMIKTIKAVKKNPKLAWRLAVAIKRMPKMKAPPKVPTSDQKLTTEEPERNESKLRRPDPRRLEEMPESLEKLERLPRAPRMPQKRLKRKECPPPERRKKGKLTL